MKKILLYLLACTVLLAAVIPPFVGYQQKKSFAEQIGVVPRGEVLRYVAADQKEFLAASVVLKVLIYFGGRSQVLPNQVQLPVDYPGISRILHSAVKLDPRNMDAHYFAQAILVWDVKQVEIANGLLEYGMRYRDWDFYLPFFVGFNSGYFLKDYEKASRMYQRAAELSGNPLFMQLAGRYLYEAGRTEHAIVYLTAMEKSTRNEAVKKNLRTRLEALVAVRAIENARDLFASRCGRQPHSIRELVEWGMLSSIPHDPYGGTFYLDEEGSVRSTSKLAFGHLNQPSTEVTQ
jgi:tetratricopeptide (TPR) repeat protein